MSSYTNQTILDSLRDCTPKVTPARSNDTYICYVQSWFWDVVAEHDLPMTCDTIEKWVAKESEVITDYFKRIWDEHKGRYDAVLRNHKAFLTKPVEIPGIIFFCTCMEYN